MPLKNPTRPHNVREKHFLDTSVLRPLLLGSTAYRQHLSGLFPANSRYISIYVQMEMRRSFIRSLVAFYSVLQMPTVFSIQDAITLWSNEFKQSRLKAIIQLVAQILGTHDLNFSQEKDKEKASIVLASYIIRFESKLHQSFKDPGQDTTRCTRALVRLPYYADDVSRGLQEFAQQFDDTNYCRDNCSIDHVLLRRYSAQVKSIIDVANSTASNNDTRGFLAIANQLAIIVEKGPGACSCHRCEKIGDAVITLETPRDMLLAHLDNSFNYLCPPVGQGHSQPLSETAFHKTLNT
jgi:hypothetical protein